MKDQSSDVRADDLRGFGQCHFFAGIGGWPLALKLARWPDDRPVWTGSCPCQPFSAAGKGKAFADDRHLWPEWFRLIGKYRPATVIGEQVDAAIGWGWLDAVFADLEGEGYACGSAVLPACGVGAPHRRNRLWFVGHSAEQSRKRFAGSGGARELADAECTKSARFGQYGGEVLSEQKAEGLGRSGELGHAERAGLAQQRSEHGVSCGQAGATEGEATQRTGAFDAWADLEWLPCTDGKARPTQPGIQQMVDGLSESLGPVRADQIAKIEEEINAAAGEGNRGKAVFDMWHSLAEEALRRPFGGLRSLQEAPVLLAFLFQLAEQGWQVPQGVPQSRAEASRAMLRMLRGDDEAARPSCGRGLDEQQIDEPANAVRVLSSILARHTQAAWGDALAKNVADAFPLASGIPGRVGQLRAYGNAIVPQTAQAFVEAVMECRP